MRTRAVVLALVAVAGLGLASCSDDDDDGASGSGNGQGKGLSAKELATRGDAVCTRFAGEVQKLASEFDQTIIFTPEQMQTLYTKMVPLVDGAIAEFKALDAPSTLDEKYDAAIAQMEVDRQKLVTASESQESARKLYDGQVDPFQSTNEKLAAAGITACSGGSAAGGDASGEVTTTTAPAG